MTFQYFSMNHRFFCSNVVRVLMICVFPSVLPIFFFSSFIDSSVFQKTPRKDIPIKGLSSMSRVPLSPPLSPSQPRQPFYPGKLKLKFIKDTISVECSRYKFTLHFLLVDQSFGSNTSQTSNILHSSASPIYGDSTLISPNKRINRRYL